jgi:predicted HTH transcriptional regulator
VIEGNKQQYYLALRRTQVSLQRDESAPDWLPWFTFFLRSMRKQKDNLLRKVERERQFLQAMPKLDAEILQLTRENGRTTTPEIVIATQATRANVRKRLEALVNSNLLKKHGRSTGTWYTLPL